jgi:hypothetical protein
MSLTNTEYYKKQKQESPWMQALYHTKQRCINPNNDNYSWYGGRGIEFHLTNTDGEYLWFRDKAYLMKWPTIDRKDKNKNYIFDNCQFIENAENSCKDKRKIVLQYDLQGNFIKEWISVREAERNLNISSVSISRVCRGVYKQINRFVFKYKGFEQGTCDHK